jgi:uncharacterized membrane-anchored protein YhcB (DUF1043 family)
MKLHQLKEFVKQTIREEQDYQQLFKHMLDKTGKSIADMSDDDKKKFFNAVDTAYKAKSEGRLRGYNEAELTAGQKKIDVDKDGEIEGSDLAALRAGKTNEAGDERFDWPPVLDKFKGKEIDKVEAEYKASLAKSSAILDKQRQLIRTTLGNKFEFPWENYDKWPAKLKAEVERLTQELEKSRAKQPEMFKKLMQARGTWR